MAFIGFEGRCFVFDLKSHPALMQEGGLRELFEDGEVTKVRRNDAGLCSMILHLLTLDITLKLTYSVFCMRDVILFSLENLSHSIQNSSISDTKSYWSNLYKMNQTYLCGNFRLRTISGPRRASYATTTISNWKACLILR